MAAVSSYWDSPSVILATSRDLTFPKTFRSQRMMISFNSRFATWHASRIRVSIRGRMIEVLDLLIEKELKASREDFM